MNGVLYENDSLYSSGTFPDNWLLFNVLQNLWVIIIINLQKYYSITIHINLLILIVLVEDFHEACYYANAYLQLVIISIWI